MRNLCFIVEGQKLKPDPACDFNNIVSNSRGYLQARFRFSADWKGCKKAAVFTGEHSEECVGLRGDCCMIPASVLTGNVVQVSVVGQNQEGTCRIPTNTIEFHQKTGR